MSQHQEAPLSAKGTRLNRRGRQTRELLLRAALEALAGGERDAVSASRIARDAGVTWGTVQHQFGDVDGLWAGVLDHVLADRGMSPPRLPESADLAERIEAVLDLLWRAMDLPASRAIHTLRAALPRSRSELEHSYPETARAIAAWDQAWTATVAGAFDGLGLDPVRVARVRSLLPGAMRGLYNEQFLSSYTDPAEARRGLADALLAYLDPHSSTQESR